MPIITKTFSPSLPFRNTHFNTVYRPLFMKDTINYQRKRITTWDADFIDLDFSLVESKTLVLLIHGLEGSSESNYMITTSNHLNKIGFDTVCMNLRGCSGEDNVLLETYHSGKTDDVDFVIKYLKSSYNYENIIIIGFSLGGNLTLKYLGEYSDIPSEVKGGVAVSVPVDLTSSQAELNKLKNKIYLNEFLRTMKLKLLQKAEKFPDFQLDKELLFKASKFRHLEKQYTVPVFGFKSSEDYWQKASAKPFIPEIKVPTLLINALDDSFLSKECYPIKEAKNMKNFYLSTPNYGGHVGFMSSFSSTENRWLEQQIAQFIQKTILKQYP
ncbi:alpha/beta fold hydrolase [Tenacibaculum sp. 1_MG-2023]|uniref:YheT family hydrolase n=1 Tax=Tenacibaculum sp. 1_MG-2023 TaxID=3062653 RepID=UPI0026E46729|nr:alpha/beta fold hydrolase [Tenacibaculum sp. 1_MG-2023]MDO6675719.1 alpha/beta fold hydrolase [Tenacibaculum sp. 1_MG-2023]